MRPLVVSPLLCLLGACHAVFPYEATGDASASRDGPGGDLRTADRSLPGLADRGRALDLRPNDGPGAGEQTLSREDGPLPPADVSLPPDDGPPPIADVQASVAGCNAALATEAAVSPSLAFCVSASGSTYDQCNASTLCNTPAWTVCSATQYRQAFDGSGAMPPVMGAWISGCIRDGGSPFLPTDGPCACKENLAPSPTPVSWRCADNSLVAANSVARHLGLASGGMCQQVGAPDPAAAGYWQPVAAHFPRNSVACCRP